jgi:hypothetical protein
MCQFIVEIYTEYWRYQHSCLDRQILYLKIQIFWGDIPRRLVNSKDVSQALGTLSDFTPNTYTLGKCRVVRVVVEILYLVAWCPHLTTFEGLHFLHLRIKDSKRVGLCDSEDKAGYRVTIYQSTPRNITSCNSLIIRHRPWVVVTLTADMTKRMS